MGEKSWQDAYVVAKTKTQLVKAVLDEIHISQEGKPEQNMINELSFGYRVLEQKGKRVEAFLKVRVEGKSTGTGERLLDIDCVYKGIFERHEEDSDQNFIDFVEIQAVPSLVPYVRSLLAFLSAQMGITPIILPTMDIIQSLIDNSDMLKRDEMYDSSN